MGLFGKKKVKESESDQLFKQFGGETNAVKEPQRQTRKQAVQNAAAAHVSSVKKEQLLERMALLRKNMYSHPEFDSYFDKLEKTTYNLKSMPDNVNKEAMGVVDNFLLGALNDALNYCNRGNYIALGACLDNIEGFVSDRFQCGSYYTDLQFQKNKLERNRLYIEQQNYRSEYARLEARMEKLKADAANPALHLSRDHIVMEVQDIKAQGAKIKTSINNIGDRIKLLDKAIGEIRDHSIAHANDSVFDLNAEMDDVLRLKRENEHDAAFTDKLNEKMDESHRKVSASALDINGDVFESNTPIELNDDLFKM